MASSFKIQWEGIEFWFILGGACIAPISIDWQLSVPILDIDRYNLSVSRVFD
jgi:hypothetical protein